MVVYVDDMRRRAKVGSLDARWSHLLADSPEELRAFAEKLSLSPKWIQHEGTYREHFDVTDSVRSRALLMGAQYLTYPRGTGHHLNQKKDTYGKLDNSSNLG